VAGRPAGTELVDLATLVADGVYAITMNPPLAEGFAGRVTVQVRDRQGNLTRVDRDFHVVTSGVLPTPTAQRATATVPAATATHPPWALPVRLYLPWVRRLVVAVRR
jgi:hypothetical protein